MAYRSKFFDSIDDDREYTSDSWARWVRAIVSEGFAPGIGDDLEIIETDPPSMNVQMQLGVLWINGRYFEVYSSPEVLPVEEAHNENPRLDLVVVQLDMENREIVPYVKTGQPATSPTLPQLEQTATRYELGLASLAINAGQTSVPNSAIVDLRNDDEYCGRSLPVAFEDHRQNSPIDHPDGSVTTVKIANNAITTIKIPDGNVTNPKIANSAVSQSKLDFVPIQSFTSQSHRLHVGDSSPSNPSVGDIWVDTTEVL